MPSNYFDFLEQNSTPEVQGTKGGSTDEEMVNLTVRADADCQVVCDGDFLFLLNANQIVKERAPAGQHLIQFIALEDSDVIIEKIIDWPTPGKNYLEIVTGLKEKVSYAIHVKEEARAEAEARAKAEAEARAKAEAEARAKAEAEARAKAEAIYTIEFTAKLGGKGKYTGRLKDGKPEGKGKVEFNSGSFYEGDFHNGWRYGKGILHYPDGGFYEGDFVDDMRTGKGKETLPNGFIYVGEFLNGEYNGDGRVTLPSGNIFEGHFHNGNPTDKGKLIYDDMDYFNGGAIYDGNINGWYLPHGKGEMRFSDGTIYEGDWNDGSRVGKGKYSFSNGDVYEGEFNDDKRTGKGKMTYSDGSIYEGDWQDDKRTGKGKYTYSNGDIYEGDWQDDKRTGEGKYTFSNGGVLEGIWGNIFSDNQKVRGRDLRIKVKISPADMAKGIHKTIKYNNFVLCPGCQGRGYSSEADTKKCDHCLGTGKVEKIVNTILGVMKTTSLCPYCHGNGKSIINPCGKCKGDGLVKNVEGVSFLIPAGSHDGIQLRIPGKGNESRNGGEKGDLLVQVEGTK